MAYIAPNSTIKLFSGVPLDNTYRNTLYFANETQQLQYFATTGVGLVATLNNQMYQRVSQGVCKVELSFGTAYTVNYMAFKNTDFENKWFYAFVNDVKYINNGVCEIDYEIDVMQTFMFDVDLQPCLVEREHIAKAADTIGANILPEQFDVGEYVYTNITQLLALTSYCVILGMVDDKSSEFANPSPGAAVQSILDVGLFDATLPKPSEGFYNGVYSGLQYYRFDVDGSDVSSLQAQVQAITDFIDQHIKTVDNIYSLYMCPTTIAPLAASDHKIDLTETSAPLELASPSGALSTSAQFEGYTPINKKLYTYPYNFYGVTNAQGSGLVLRYEFFKNAQGAVDFYPKFEVNNTFVDPVTLVARPFYYKGSGSTVDINESLTLTNFPLCSWSYDTYSRWVTSQLPQEKRAMLTNMITSGIQFIAGAASAAVSGGLGAGFGIQQMANAGTNLISKTASLYEKRYEAAIAQDPVKGNSANGNADFGSGYLGFWEYRGHITGQVAKEIDQYFSLFGYQTNEVKVPNRTGRTIWNYVKTANCTLTKRSAGKVTAADISQMESIYDNGITFWHKPDKVGNYSDANMRAN